ncbi:MAG TPA: UDP-3-O-acyl-N-acetylglucosamine deacetylase [Candidatus Polarisedimenticolia bacterium]|nr:UDP-3-O-acyl-N-acetylglucosamine deacetylase [Candidatus Polarisedimenticolia bacterium]
MFEQRTLQREIVFEGTGLHSGKRARLRLLPSSQNTGVAFIRTDLGGHVIPARGECLQESRLSTSLNRHGVQISTVEHLLAALAGLGIDNARIEVDGPEVPILDGSASPFVDAILEVGLLRQETPRRFLTVLRPVSVSDADKRLVIFPSNEFRVTYAIDFPHFAIGYQEREFQVSARTFAEEIAPARTFCLFRDVEEMRRQGLALGGGLDNAVVVGDDGILTGSLRFQDEFVRHKILDLVGDLSLVGRPVRGHVVVFKGGHRLHAGLVHRLLATPEAWALTGGRDSLPSHLLHSYERQKAGILPGQALTA